MRVKHVVQGLLAAFVVWWLVTQPGGAMHLVNSIGGYLSSLSQGLVRGVGRL